jgi:hypothetical protein
MHESLKLGNENDAFTGNDIKDLYQMLRYYGWSGVEEAAERMFSTSSTPLENHWMTFDHFEASYQCLWRYARQVDEEEFVNTLENGKWFGLLIADTDLKDRFSSNNLDTERESICLFKFLKSMEDKFYYDIAMVEGGQFYPPAF